MLVTMADGNNRQNTKGTFHGETDHLLHRDLARGYEQCCLGILLRPSGAVFRPSKRSPRRQQYVQADKHLSFYTFSTTHEFPKESLDVLEMRLILSD